MAGPHSLTDVDRELAEALRAEPSGEFRARIRARVASEAMNDRWRLPLPAAAYAGVAGVIMAGALWFMSFGQAPGRQMRDQVPSGHPTMPATDTTSIRSIPSATNAERVPGSPARDVPGRLTIARKTTAPPPSNESPAMSSRAADIASGPEVLLSDSERAGVQLLLESAASGRLRLPEEMLRDLSLPIVEARTTISDPDLPWVTVEGAVQ
jgi:hypothetical protein